MASVWFSSFAASSPCHIVDARITATSRPVNRRSPRRSASRLPLSGRHASRRPACATGRGRGRARAQRGTERCGRPEPRQERVRLSRGAIDHFATTSGNTIPDQYVADSRFHRGPRSRTPSPRRGQDEGDVGLRRRREHASGTSHVRHSTATPADDTRSSAICAPRPGPPARGPLLNRSRPATSGRRPAIRSPLGRRRGRRQEEAGRHQVAARVGANGIARIKHLQRMCARVGAPRRTAQWRGDETCVTPRERGNSLRDTELARRLTTRQPAFGHRGVCLLGSAAFGSQVWA